MIARTLPDGRQLMDAEALVQWSREWLREVNERKVRRHCQPVEYDARSGRALYDAQAVVDRLTEVFERNAGIRPSPVYRRRARPHALRPAATRHREAT